MALDLRPRYSVPDYSGLDDPFYLQMQQMNQSMPQYLSAIGELQKKRKQQEGLKRIAEQYPEVSDLIQYLGPEHAASAISSIIKARQSAAMPKETVTVWQDPKTGGVSRTEQAGWLPTEVTGGQALQMTAIPAMVGARASAEEQKQKTKQLTDDWKEVRKVVNPYRTQGIGGSASTFNRAAQANQAAARGLKILNKPSLTWQELNAFVNTDIASIQRGGTPTDIQLHESNYNTLLGKIGGMKTFVTGKPSKGLVPEETRNQIRQNIMDIIDVDNQIIDDGISFAESAYPEAISSHKGSWESIKKDAQKIKTLGQSENKSFFGGENESSDPNIAILQQQFPGAKIRLKR